MVWAACTVIQGRVISQVNQMEVFHPSATGLWFRWQLECSDQAGIVYGFRVQYCHHDNCRSVSLHDQRHFNGGIRGVGEGGGAGSMICNYRYR
jgi:hypothetical protein